MSACPFCFTEPQGAFSQAMPREACARCGAQWMDGELLEKVIGHTATDALLRQAKGQPGQCKGCQESLQYVPNCPGCGRKSPTCPQCGAAPLRVAEVHGVKVDICVPCRGIGLDAGELELLEAAAKRERFLEFDLKPQVPQAAGAPMQCVTCRRALQPQYAFACDNQLYCGSCAPEGASPYDVELTKADPGSTSLTHHSFYTMDGTLRTIHTGPTATGDAVSGGLAWLFSKLLG
jgi:Zn-finger nucleic acid-binding protein